MIALVREGAIKDYVLPKGKVEDGESFEEAARREIEEEAGVSELKLLAELGSESRLNYEKTKWVTTHFFLFSTTQVQTFATDSSRDYSTQWYDIDQLPEMYWREQKELILKNLELIKKLV